jgi:hypothetical protein
VTRIAVPIIPLVPADVWRAALIEAGFDEVFSTTETDTALAQDSAWSTPSDARFVRH